MQFEREPDADDQIEDDAQSYSSYYPESLIDDEEAIQNFKQKIIALSTELHVNFEDIGYIREHRGIRAFPLTMRNPPEGATWSDGTRAVLRVNGWWSLNGRRSHESYSEDESEPSPDGSAVIEASDNPDQVDMPTSRLLNRVYSVRDSNDRIEDSPSLQETQLGNIEAESAAEPQSPVSVTSETSASSNFTGTTLLDEDYDSDTDSDEDDDNDMDDQWERLDETLLSKLLEDHGVPAPNTLAFDVSVQNALKRPYAIQTFLPGDRVSKVHREKKEMSLEDRLWLADEAAELRVRLETIQFQGTGRLQANADGDMTAGRLPLNMSVAADIDEHLHTVAFLVQPHNPYTDRSSAKGRLYYSLYDAMFLPVDDLMAKAIVKWQVHFESGFRAYVAIKDILRDMDNLGWFVEADKAYSKSVLNHGSINDSQLLVERTGDPSKPWRLTGVIGFDEADTVPSVLTRKPWSFLWDVYDASELLPEETRFGWNGDVDELPTELPYLAADDLKVKQHYEDVLIEKLYTPQYGDKAREKYFDDTYGRGRWLRRLFGFAREGVPFPCDGHRFNKLLRDWNRYKKSKNVKPRPLDLWEGLPDYVHAKQNQMVTPPPVRPPTPPSSVGEDDSDALASSSLRHVYSFMNPPSSPSSSEAATTEVTDDSSA